MLGNNALTQDQIMRFWNIEVAQATELVEHSNGNPIAFVGVMRAMAILEINRQLMERHEIMTFNGLPE